MEIEVKYRNGVNEEGIVSVDFLPKDFNAESLYKTFRDEYFFKINKKDVVIISDGYPINDFRLKKLLRELNKYVDRSVEFDVFFSEVWENKVKLRMKRKLESSNNELEPKKKKRKLH